MAEFDYKRAWRELAEPSYRALPQNIRDLYVRVQHEAVDMAQDANLDVIWPEHAGAYPEPLRSVFEKIPAEELAHAARTIYSRAHWAPGGSDAGGSGVDVNNPVPEESEEKE